MTYPLPERHDAARLYHSEHGLMVFCPTTGQMYRPSVIRPTDRGGSLWCDCTECDAKRGTRDTALTTRPQPHLYQGVQLCTY